MLLNRPMLGEVSEFFSSMFGVGLEGKELGPLQIIVRALAIYVVAVAIVKLGSKRLFGRATVFDNIVAIMLGSIMSRGILNTEFIPTVIAGASLVGIHWLFATIAFHTETFGPIVKGEPVLLVKDGEIQNEGMEGSRISKNDLLEAVRLQVRHGDLSKVKEAYLERNGKISIIPSTSEPQILDVDVKEGVQSVRIKLE